MTAAPTERRLRSPQGLRTGTGKAGTHSSVVTI